MEKGKTVGPTGYYVKMVNPSVALKRHERKNGKTVSAPNMIKMIKWKMRKGVTRLWISRIYANAPSIDIREYYGFPQ